MPYSKSVGKKIAEARKKIKISQAELAQQISISPQAVGKWERGESMPDISTLNRLAGILGVDLNYFSDDFRTSDPLATAFESVHKQIGEAPISKNKIFFDWNWDVSSESWVDADFSGLKNLKEKFCTSSLKNCKFLDSELSGLTFSSNEIINCNFMGSDLRNSKFQASEISKNVFINCSLIDAEFTKSEIKDCNFKNGNFSGTEFLKANFQNNLIEMAVWKHTSFKGTHITNIVFEGDLEDCSFEACTFKEVKFQNAIIKNTFFKHNDKLNRAKFIDCKMDSLTYTFLKNGKADLTGVTMIN